MIGCNTKGSRARFRRAAPAERGGSGPKERSMKHKTRRTSPFLLLTLLVLMLSALFAGVLTACGGTEEEDPPAMSGDEVGVYYAEAPGSGR